MTSFFYNVFKLLLLLILPFVLLIRGSIFFHTNFAWNSWVCLGAGVGVTAVVLFIYFSFFYGTLTGRFGDFDAMKRRALIAILVVLLYSGYGILFFSNANLKSTALQNEMSNLHPVLRLSLSTLVFMDKDLLITDASRVPEDYKKMGLKTLKNSLHYKQPSTGYTHAVDLRTSGRDELKNTLVTWYFRLMGFRTLRHVGTGDHLHVSLLSHDVPGGR